MAPSPEAAWAGLILRRVATSEQPLWQILKDIRRYPVYRIDAPGVRIKDRTADSRLAGGPRVLRKEGEEAQVPEEDLRLVTLGATAPSEQAEPWGGTSRAWRAIAAHFEHPILAVVLPDDSPPWMARPDCPVIASVPRLENLTDGELLTLPYEADRRLKIRNFRGLTDAWGKPIGKRFISFLVKQMVHDFFSLKRQRSRRDWLTLALAVLPPLGAIAGLVTRLIELAS